jgi:arsenate reductase
MTWVVFGIATCGTVRKARAWLDAQGIAHRFVDLREEPPSRERVEGWARAFGVAAMKNTSGGSYRALGPEKDGWSDARWVDAFVSDPMLIRRPVIERDGEPAQVGWRAPVRL